MQDNLLVDNSFHRCRRYSHDLHHNAKHPKYMNCLLNNGNLKLDNWRGAEYNLIHHHPVGNPGNYRIQPHLKYMLHYRHIGTDFLDRKALKFCQRDGNINSQQFTHTHENYNYKLCLPTTKQLFYLGHSDNQHPNSWTGRGQVDPGKIHMTHSKNDIWN